MRWTLSGGYLFKYCSVKYQTFHQVSEKTSQQTKSFPDASRSYKTSNTCPIELTSGSFLIGKHFLIGRHFGHSQESPGTQMTKENSKGMRDLT